MPLASPPSQPSARRRLQSKSPSESIFRRKKKPVPDQAGMVFRSFTLFEQDDEWLFEESKRRGITVSELLRRLVVAEQRVMAEAVPVAVAG